MNTRQSTYHLCLFHPSNYLTRLRRYSEVRTAQVNHLLSALSSGSEEESKTIREKLEQKIDCYSAGGLDHAVDVISSVWEASNKERSTTGGTEGTSPPSVPPLSPLCSWISAITSNVTTFDGCDMRLQLIKSIREGYLFDRRYWARRSREGVIEPIYFSEDVIRAELTCLDGCKLLRSGSCQSVNYAR